MDQAELYVRSRERHLEGEGTGGVKEGEVENGGRVLRGCLWKCRRVAP